MNKLLTHLLPIICIVLTSGGGFSLSAQTPVFTGKVSDETTKEPIPYATVAIEGSSEGCFTDIDGTFSLRSLPKNAVIVVSYVGYATKSVPVSPGTSHLDILMKAEATALEAVVAVGYGTMKRSDVTGAVASVSAEDLKMAPVATVDQAMQGRIAGVTVNASSGQPGQPAEVRIRGIGTVNNSSPIYVVDGILTEDISFLNSGDIASMEILKDASSTAIYGSRGANGVIIITTKQGSEERINVSFDAYYGIQNIWKTLDLMKRDELAQTIVDISGDADQRKQLKRGFNNWLAAYRTGTSEYYPTFDSFDYSRQETDWQKEVTRRNAGIQNYHLTIDGGAKGVKYALSAGYFDQDGTIKSSFYERLTLRSNIQFDITKWLSVGTNVSYINCNSQDLL